jgi:hypothetical protein
MDEERISKAEGYLAVITVVEKVEVKEKEGGVAEDGEITD